MKKIIAMVIVFVMVMAFASTAFAESGDLSDFTLTGGPSQQIGRGVRDEPNSMDLRVNSISWNGQSNFNIRGYDTVYGSTCTYKIGITGTGYFQAYYTADPVFVKMMGSIASTSSGDSLTFSGTYYL